MSDSRVPDRRTCDTVATMFAIPVINRVPDAVARVLATPSEATVYRARTVTVHRDGAPADDSWLASDPWGASNE